MEKDYTTYADFKAGLAEQRSAEHVVEDMRSRPQSHKKESRTPAARPQRKPHRRRGALRTAVFLVLVVVLLFSLALLCADFLLPTGVTGYITETFAPAPAAVYAVSAGAFDALGEARALSDNVRRKGGAGFIAYDGRYHVLLSAYHDRDQAQAVADKHGYTVYPILTEGMSTADFPLAYRAKVKPLVGYHVDLYRTLYDLSDGLAQKGTTVAYCRERVRAALTALQEKAEPFLSSAEKATDAATLNYRSGVLAAQAALNNLIDQSTDADFLTDLRWTYIMVLRINRI